MLFRSRKHAKAKVLWLENGDEKSIETDSPTEVVKQLFSQFSGEIPGLQIVRPSLEDIYIKMIGENIE